MSDPYVYIMRYHTVLYRTKIYQAIIICHTILEQDPYVYVVSCALPPQTVLLGACTGPGSKEHEWIRES